MDRFSYEVVQTGNSLNFSNQPYQLTLHFKQQGGSAYASHFKGTVFSILLFNFFLADNIVL